MDRKKTIVENLVDNKVNTTLALAGVMALASNRIESLLFVAGILDASDRSLSTRRRTFRACALVGGTTLAALFDGNFETSPVVFGAAALAGSVLPGALRSLPRIGSLRFLRRA